MEINLTKVKVRDLITGYIDSGDSGVVGFDGKLDIRPKYQREFVYNDKQQRAVIDTVLKNFPLNVFYWVQNGQDSYEVLDGQQRILSICKYTSNQYSFIIDGMEMQFHNLQESKSDLAEKILNYELMVFIIKNGTESERLDWFKIINIAGEKLNDQELRNAVYTGTWLSDAKVKFSKPDGMAYQLGNKYLKGNAIRQDYLETTLSWISNNNIEKYMSKHQDDPNANQLWRYFSSVINWVQTTFTVYRKKEMQGVNWGELYNKYKDKIIDSQLLEKKIKRLMIDDDVTKKSGIYNYVFTLDERKLNIRAFNSRDKRSAYERQSGICPVCKKHFRIDEMEADHITPWSKGGKTISENCKMLCKSDNRAKGNI